MISHPAELIREYFRKEMKVPIIWCPGCGNGIILASMLRAIGTAGLAKRDVALVSGIGCSARTPGYLDFKTMHTTHGRALAFATGLKLANPGLQVIVPTGDGDLLAIGGNHFIHAARRNVDLTVVLFNNYNYGMTGGQYSPTTPVGSRATTAPKGTTERPFDVMALSAAAGATYCARTTIYHVAQMDRMIARGIANRGFSVIEVMTTCPTLYGRLNKVGTPGEMIALFARQAVPLAKAKTLSPEELAGKIVTGEFVAGKEG